MSPNLPKKLRLFVRGAQNGEEVLSARHEGDAHLELQTRSQSNVREASPTFLASEVDAVKPLSPHPFEATALPTPVTTLGIADQVATPKMSGSDGSHVQADTTLVQGDPVPDNGTLVDPATSQLNSKPLKDRIGTPGTQTAGTRIANPISAGADLHGSELDARCPTPTTPYPHQSMHCRPQEHLVVEHKANHSEQRPREGLAPMRTIIHPPQGMSVHRPTG